MEPVLQLKTFNKDTIAFGPRNDPWQVALNDPATTVMTDFRERPVFTIDADEKIDEALQQMKHAGLRAAFVMDKQSDGMLGIITAYDIIGDKAMRHLQSVGFNDHAFTRSEICVRDIMDKVEDWRVAEVRQIVGATVKSVLEALQRNRRSHLPVMETMPDGNLRLRGIFSLSKLLRLTQGSRNHSPSLAMSS